MTRLLLYSLAGLSAAMYFATGALSQTPPTVRVDGGDLQGVVADGVVSFKGIPFAAPPVGDLRWRPPQPVARWTGVRQAAEFGPTVCRDDSARLARPVRNRRGRRRKTVYT